MRRFASHPIAFSIALLSFSLLAAPVGAELYEWTDDDGRVHYSNEPRPGSDPVGLAPIALPPEGAEQDDDSPTDTKRRERLKRQRAERWVDSQDELPATMPDSALEEEQETTGPAAPAEDDHGLRARECQARHGMSCLQFEAWLQMHGHDCEEGLAGSECRAAAKITIRKAMRDKARKRLEAEDAARLAR